MSMFRYCIFDWKKNVVEVWDQFDIQSRALHVSLGCLVNKEHLARNNNEQNENKHLNVNLGAYKLQLLKVHTNGIAA